MTFSARGRRDQAFLSALDRRVRIRDCAIGLVVVVAMHAATAWADEVTCGDLKNSAWADGPHDYRTAPKSERDLVERYHFSVDVEMLRHGASTALAGTDIDYTLRAFPNHPRALLAMSRLGLKEGRPQPSGANYPVECYFDRAFRFRPDDAIPYMVAGIHLAKTGQKSDAIKYLDQASVLAGEGDANLEYNLGLGYLEAERNEKALEHAKRAYALGFPLPGLKNLLVQKGAWKD